MIIAMAADHGWYELKNAIRDHLTAKGYQVADLGTNSGESVDYPEYGRKCAEYVISGKADLAAAGITITEDRKKNVDFSDPYVKTGIVVIFKKSNPFKDKDQLKGRKIGVQAGTTSETFVTDQLKQEPERSKSPAEAVAALKAGRVEFVIADIDPAKNCVKGEADLALSDFITSEEYAVAIRKGQPELLKAINETIAEIKKDGRLAKWIVDFTAESDKLMDK